jgi:krueppel-like family protein
VTTPKQNSKTPQENHANLYACFNPSALSLLAPQFIANQTAAAAALMASWPMQLRAQLASSIGLPNPTPFFPPGWPMTPPLSHKSTSSPPPTSPISPVHKKKLMNNNYINNNHIVVSTTTDLMVKKKRKVDDKNDHTVPGSISPPTSSSSPQSNNSAEFASSTRDPSKDKVFTCKVCNRSFGYKHVLQNHERTHTGEVK